MNIIETLNIDTADLKNSFMSHQIDWIEGEDRFHEAGRQVVALAEKSVRIGWTYADAFKNVRKRLRFPKRDYLFATKDYPSALEYMRMCKEVVRLFNLGHSVVSHGEENFRLPRSDAKGRASAFTEDVKVGVIKFDNGSRIIAFSANPQAMAVYGGDVGLDEFAKHPNARLLWETAQGRVTWGYDLAIWSSHDGEDTLFNEFAQEARASVSRGPKVESRKPDNVAPAFDSRPSTVDQVKTPWNIYHRVTIEDAINNGLVEVINKSRGTKFTADQFLADCRARARDEEIFQQAYMCNPLGAATNHIVEWSAIERCRHDYKIERVHLEADEIQRKFGPFSPDTEEKRVEKIAEFLEQSFPVLFGEASSASPTNPSRGSRSSPLRNGQLRLGFDVAASGQGDLAVLYIDELQGNTHWLRALLTCRTEDWHFLKVALFAFMASSPNVRGAGDETGLGRQICWEAGKKFGSRWKSVNFASKKHGLGFTLMNQLSVAEKRFPRSEHDIAGDYFALKKMFNGNKWAFSEGKNALNPASHCDIAWAGALASEAPTQGGFGFYWMDDDGNLRGYNTMEGRINRPIAEKKPAGPDPTIGGCLI